MNLLIIYLFRNAHHGELSKSVENLLELAVEPSKECQISVADQLDRLSSAFDAIQKYLEVNNTVLRLFEFSFKEFCNSAK